MTVLLQPFKFGPFTAKYFTKISFFFLILILIHYFLRTPFGPREWLAVCGLVYLVYLFFSYLSHALLDFSKTGTTFYLMHTLHERCTSRVYTWFATLHMWCNYRYSSSRQWNTTALQLIGFFIRCKEHRLKVLLKRRGHTEYSRISSFDLQILIEDLYVNVNFVSAILWKTII